MQFYYELLHVTIQIRLYLHPNSGGHHFGSLDPTPRLVRIVVRHLSYRQNIESDIRQLSYEYLCKP